MESKPKATISIDDFISNLNKLAINPTLDDELRKRCIKTSESLLSLKKALVEEELVTIMRIPSILLVKIVDQIQTPELGSIKDIFDSVIVLPLKQILDLVDSYADILPQIDPEELYPITESCTIEKLGFKFTKQKIYACSTCKLYNPKMICQYCAQICHKDHKIMLLAEGQGICDCRFEKTPCKLTKCCSKIYTGTDFQEQPRFSCKTCNLVDTHAICGHCIQKCHAGHDVKSEGIVKHYCDCSTTNKCKSTKLP